MSDGRCHSTLIHVSFPYVYFFLYVFGIMAAQLGELFRTYWLNALYKNKDVTH